ncbi:MAG: DUF2285 domain-containing protein [Pseudomonadota bacterium]|nr:DUF2285 domain-containing protein [Pseudomonadota bacterium]
MIPPWLPDWKDEAAYSKQLTPRGWAWEFLRRNPEYQSDYQVFSQLPDAEDGRLTGKWKGSPWPGGRCDYFYCDPPALPGELFEDYRVRTRNEYEVIPWADHIVEKWELYPPHNPADARYGPAKTWWLFYADDRSEEVHFCPPVSRERALETHPDAIDAELPILWWFPNNLEEQGLRVCWDRASLEGGLESWHSPPIVFDLRRSIEAQLREILNELREAREVRVTRAARIEGDHIYRTYLRLLDAELSGASRGEMAEILYPENPGADTVSKALSTAKKLRDCGYRDLIARP